MSVNKTPLQMVKATPLDKVVEALKVRCSWPLMRQILAASDLKPGAGWDDLIAKGVRGDASGNSIAELVRNTYLEIVYAGDRIIQLYDVDENGADAVRDRLASASVAPSAFSPTYPVPLDLSALLQAPIDLTLCEVRNTPGGDVQLVFCSRRDVEERLTVDKTSTPAVMSAFSQALGGYDRFVAYKYTHVQVFDVVTIRPKLGRIEISLDIAQRGYFFDSSIHAMKLTNAVSLLVPDLVFEGQSPRNLFSAIEGIYSAPKTTDVNIIDIGFRTASGAVNRGKMPTVHEDIREERFHKAGAVADKQVTPNGVIGAWTFMHPKGGAKIKLWVPVSQAASSNPVLDSMEVRDAKADSDVLQAVNKVVKYL